MVDTTLRKPGAAARSSCFRRLRIFWSGGSWVADLPNEGRLIIGREASTVISIPDPSVSRQHCAVECGSAVVIEDLGSTNGTSIGGRRLEPGKKHILLPGTAATLGGAVVVLEETEQERAETGGLVATPDSELAKLLGLVDRVASGDLSVLVFGETGVGKEHIAARVHQASPRRSRAFVRLSCAALPENLLESELFGYEKGAFTGATATRPGLIEVADGGTMFLDEIGELPLGLQAKLLRVVESGEVLRLGSRSSRHVQVRYVSATNRDLHRWSQTGQFRSDLYYRLAGVVIQVPPLRSRRNEVAPLARAFLKSWAHRLSRPEPVLTQAALDALSTYDWPGNIRELKNAVERGALLATDTIEPDHLGIGVELTAPAPTLRSLEPPPPPPVVEPPEPPSSGSGATGSLQEAARAAERERIRMALEQSGGNQTLAAEQLGISRRTLLRRLDELDLPRPRKPLTPGNPPGDKQ